MRMMGKIDYEQAEADNAAFDRATGVLDDLGTVNIDNPETAQAIVTLSDIMGKTTKEVTAIVFLRNIKRIIA